MAGRVHGPASYFPSIEATYGRTIADWKADLRVTGITSHKELVAWLQNEHGFGHGHASALTSHLLAEGTQRPTTAQLIDRLFPGRKARWRPVYDRLAQQCQGFGEVNILPKATLVGIGTKVQFTMLQPSTPDRFDVGLKLPGVEPTQRLEAAGNWNPMMTHRVRITEPDQVDAALVSWLREAYQWSLRWRHITDLRAVKDIAAGTWTSTGLDESTSCCVGCRERRDRVGGGVPVRDDVDFGDVAICDREAEH